MIFTIPHPFCQSDSRLDFLHVGPVSFSNLISDEREEICNRTINLGRNEFGVEINFYSLRMSSFRCETTIEIAPGYTGTYYLGRMSGNCGSHLTVEYNENSTMYSFCSFALKYPFEVEIPPLSNVLLRITTGGNRRSADRFHMIFYVYQKSRYRCDSYLLRCRNGRCLERDQFCDTDYNFCGDSTYKDCYTDLQYKDDSSSFGNVIGVVALIVTLCLVFIVIGYFCCYRSKRQNAAARATPRATDIFTLSTQQDSADVDYVIDYQKFIEPPPYHTLEMTTLPTQSAQAHTIDTSGMAETEFNATDLGHNSTENTVLQRSRGQFNRNDNATEANGRTNDGYVPADDELPSYDDVLTNEERFNIDNFSYRIS